MTPVAEELWEGGVVYEGESVQMDALSLCGFVRVPRRGRGVDLGCGCGILMLLLSWARPELRLDGVDIRSGAVERAEANFRRNGLEERCRAYWGDVRTMPGEKNSYDFAVCNPPYYDPRRGGVSPDGERAVMHHGEAEIGDFCAAASALLRQGGSFFAVYTASRLPELLSAMAQCRLAPKRLRCVQHSARHAPSLILCEGRKGGKAGVQWEPPLLLREEDGRESEESLALSHWKER